MNECTDILVFLQIASVKTQSEYNLKEKEKLMESLVKAKEDLKSTVRLRKRDERVSFYTCTCMLYLFIEVTVENSSRRIKKEDVSGYREWRKEREKH